MIGRIGDRDLRATRRVSAPDAAPDEHPTDPAPEALPLPLPKSMEPAPGWLVGGRYRLERQLNSGGMGTVHLAQPIGGNQKVVVKFPHAHLVTSRGFRESFAREIRALQKLTHPHVVEIYDAGTEVVREGDAERELPYLVVRYMGGGSLKNRIAQSGGRLRPAQLQWLRPIASALDFVHSQGVVHRDVKPENLLFDVHGTVFLTDFGIAKLIGADGEIGLDAVLGSPSYMAPEAMQRTHASASETYTMDQYSLAVVVYQALCGAFPHSGDSITLLLTNKQTQPPRPIGERLPELPRPLADALMRALAHEPGARFESCGAFAEAVLAAIRPARRRRRRFALVVAASVALGGAVTYGYIEAGPGASLAQPSDALGARIAELRLRAEASPPRLAMLQQEVDAIAALARKAETNLGPPHTAQSVAVDAISLADVRERLRAVEYALENVETGQRVVAALRGATAPLTGRIEAARRGIDEQRADARVRGERLFELGLRVAQLERQSRAAPQFAGLGREIAALEAGRSSDVAVLGSMDAAVDAASVKLAEVVARLDRDQRSLEDEGSQLEQGRAALRALRARLRGPALAAAPSPAAASGPKARAAAKLVTIPGGTFLFGCDPSLAGGCDPTLQPAARSVSLPSFAIDRSEVSVAEYRACVSAEVCTPPQGLSGAECNWDRPDREQHPVNCVRFDQARAYCDWVGKVLPTEEQWEKAARGESGAPFPWGSAAPDCPLAVHAGCARSTAPIESGSAQQNAHGLHHMAGNVWEWTRTADTSVRQVVRGGSFRSNAKGLRVDRRGSAGRTSSPDGAGFRCAKE